MFDIRKPNNKANYKKEIDPLKQLSLFNSLIDQLLGPVAYIEKNKNDYRYIFVNKAYESHSNLSANIIKGAKVKDTTHKASYPKILQNLTKAFKGETIKLENEIIDKNGKTTHLSTEYVPHTVNNKTIGVFEVIQDVTECKQAEQILRENDKRFRSLLESIPSVAVQGYKLDGTTHYWNKASEHLYGYTAQEAIGKNLLDLIIPPEIRENVIQEIKKMTKTKQPIPSSELLLMRKDGTPVTVYSNHAIAHLPNNEMELFCLDIDITERKQAEQEIEENREKYRGLSKAAFECIFLSEKGICIEQNYSAEKTFGYSNDEAIGKPAIEWIAPKHRLIAMNNMLSGYEHPYETMAIKKDGTKFPCMIQGKMMHYKGKTVRVTSLRDISERKKTEKALRESDYIINSSSTVIAKTKMDGTMTYVNPAFLETWGYKNSDEVLGKAFSDFWMVSKKHNVIMTSLLGNEKKWSGELIAKKKDGTLFDVSVLAATVLDEEGTPIGLMSTSIDITERKQAEKALQHAKEAAEIASKTKSDFLAKMSHEMRTPMNAILGMTDLVLSSSLTQKQKKQLKIVQKAGDNLLSIINDILDISKIEAGKLKLAIRTFNLTKLITDTCDILEQYAKEKKLKLSHKISSSIQEKHFLGDANYLKQILINLIGNAIKYTEQGYVSIKVQPINTKKTNAPNILFEIEDTGIGIKKADQKIIFKSFIQANNSISRRFEGTGLGLNISQTLVKKMGGKIKVESKINKGSKFSFSIHLKECKQNKPSTTKTKTHEKSFLPRKTILLAEDNVFNQQYAKELLKNLKQKVIIANNGKKALEVLKKQKIDLILMDVEMPEMDGLEATRRIRKNTKYKHIPILAVTAHAMAENRKDIFKAGINDCLIKPFKANALKNLLKKYL